MISLYFLWSLVLPGSDAAFMARSSGGAGRITRAGNSSIALDMPPLNTWASSPSSRGVKPIAFLMPRGALSTKTSTYSWNML